MEYLATYTILVNGGTWGRDDYYFECDNDEQAKQIALEREHYNIEIRGDKVQELLLDIIEDENGNEIEINREQDRKLIRKLDDIIESNY